GQRLVSGRAGLAAGLLFAAFPSVSFYAEDAREYALLTAFATIASYCLIRALQAGTPPLRAGPRPRDEGTEPQATGGFQGSRSPRPAPWLIGYAAAMALLGLGNILSLLLIAAHAVTVAVWHRFYRGPGQPFVLRWLASVAAAVIVASPVAIIASRQAHQVQWIKPPGLVAIITMTGLIGPQPMFFIVVAVVVLARTTSLVSGRARLRADWPAGLWGLAVPWLFLPPALLFTVSVIPVTHPIYVFRYIAFCIPAAALLAG